MKIDHHIPPPAPPRYPFLTMRPGDSVFFPGEHTKDKHHRAYAYAKTMQKRKGLRFTGRSTIEDGVRGIRIWRID